MNVRFAVNVRWLAVIAAAVVVINPAVWSQYKHEVAECHTGDPCASECVLLHEGGSSCFAWKCADTMMSKQFCRHAPGATTKCFSTLSEYSTCDSDCKYWVCSYDAQNNICKATDASGTNCRCLAQFGEDGGGTWGFNTSCITSP
jgi:hypothetical protein